MRLCWLAALLMSIASVVSAQVIHQQTAVPVDAAFEIVQSSLAARYTFRVNRITGATYQLVHDSDDNQKWEALPPLRDPAGPSIAGRVTYYVFTSALAARWTFLMNVYTGATWILVTNPKTQDLSWERVPEPEPK